MMKLTLIALVALASNVYAAKEVRGLACYQTTSNGRDELTSVDILKVGSKLSLNFSDIEDSRVKGSIAVTASDIQPIMKNTLAKLDNKSIVDAKKGIRADFKVDGYEFDGTPRLGVTISLKNGQSLILSSCIVRYNVTASY